MSQLDAIWKRARTDLVVETEYGDFDVFLWEHSARVAHTAEQIARLPSVQAQSPDEMSIVASSLYHDAAFAAQARDGILARYELHIHPPTPADREQSAIIMEQSLAKVLPTDSLERASRVVRTLHDREVDLLEKYIVAEAESLEEFGLLSLWTTIRRGTWEGKGVQAVIDTWKKKTEYKFWAARLADSFHFAPVREIAKQRLERFEQMMSELEEQQAGSDIVLAPVDLDPKSTRQRTAI